MGFGLWVWIRGQGLGVWKASGLGLRGRRSPGMLLILYSPHPPLWGPYLSKVLDGGHLPVPPTRVPHVAPVCPFRVDFAVRGSGSVLRV